MTTRTTWVLLDANGTQRYFFEAESWGEAVEALLPAACAVTRGWNSTTFNTHDRHPLFFQRGPDIEVWAVEPWQIETEAEHLERLSLLFEDLATELDNDPATQGACNAFDLLADEYRRDAEKCRRTDEMEIDA